MGAEQRPSVTILALVSHAAPGSESERDPGFPIQHVFLLPSPRCGLALSRHSQHSVPHVTQVLSSFLRPIFFLPAHSQSYEPSKSYCHGTQLSSLMKLSSASATLMREPAPPIVRFTCALECLERVPVTVAIRPQNPGYFSTDFHFQSAHYMSSLSI